MPVVNVKTGSPFDEYIAKKRGDYYQSSIFANPYEITPYRTRERTIGMYFWYLVMHPEITQEIPRLRGKRLGCWCPPKACHGDLLLHLASGRFPDVDRVCWWQECTECGAPSYFWIKKIENPPNHMLLNPHALDPTNYTFLNGRQVMDQEKVYCPCCQVLTGAMFDVKQLRTGSLRLAAPRKLRASKNQV